MPTSLDKLVAMVMVYRRIMTVIGVGPLLVSFSPAAVWFAAFLLRCFTSYVALTLGLTLGLTEASRRLFIPHFIATAPKSKLEDHLRKHLAKISVCMFILSCYISKYVGPLLPKERSLFPDWTISEAMSASLRLGLVALIAGLFVTVRYVASFSIMRCSPFPLLSNPIDEQLRNIRNWPMTWLQPDRTNNEAKKNTNLGRRFQHPTLYFYLLHIVFAVCAGVLSYMTLLSMVSSILPATSKESGTLVGTASLLSCVLTTMTTLSPLFDGESHELDPYKYFYPYDPRYNKSTTQQENPKKALLLSFVIPIGSILLVSIFTEDEAKMDVLISLAVALGVVCGLLATYIYTIDCEIRKVLFSIPENINNLIDQFSDDTTPVTRLDVILRSLLCDASLVREVWNPNRRPGIGGPEREEISLSEKLFETFAAVLLRKKESGSESNGESPFEEDVLRVAILESLGGRLDGGTASVGDAIERHHKEINEWIGLSAMRGRGPREHLSIPLVRGLCAFIGGFGEALIICSSPPTDPAWGTVRPKAASTWTLSPTVFVLLNFAVTAVARLIERSLNASGRTLCDWKSSVLSVQIPVALKALYRLRTGIAKYSLSITQDGAKGQRPQVAHQIGACLTKSVHIDIVKICDSSALLILQSVQSPSHGRIDLLLDADCLEWKKDIWARSASG